MKRLLILLIFLLPNILLATNYVNEFPTYLYGDIRPIAAIYNAIAMISSNTIYNTIISIAVLYSIFNVGFLVITKADLIGALKSTSFTIGALSVLLVPVDVHLVDKRLDKGLITNYYDDSVLGYEKISNVPWLVAITPSVATTISSDLIELVDTVFKGNTLNYSGMKDIGKVGFADIGFGNAYESINKIVENYSFDELGTEDALNFKSDFKSYLSECVLPMSVTNKKVSANLLAPTKDIYSALSPAQIGVDSTYSITRRDGTSTDCVTFYNNEIKTNVASLTVDTNAKISKLVGVPDVLALKGLDRIALADIQSDVFASSTAQLTIYAQNLAAAPLVQSLFENYYRGTPISGQDIANNITGSKSTAAIQTQGLGQFKWMSQILPYALHFLFGIILAASILTIIMAMARGLYQGSAVARNYFAGFIQFESIRVSLALVNNLVLYYSVIDAADKLTAFGGNPIAITRIPSYLNYIATMEGISGILGISAIFIIPMIALKGDVTSAASAMQSLSGRYQGNDIENATEAISKSSAREKALATNEEAITAKLSKMGLSVPAGRAPIDYYNSVTNDLQRMNSGIGNMINQDKMDNYSKGVVAKTTSDISNTAGFGSTANLDSISRVSQQDGQVMGNTTNFTDSMRSSTGWDGTKVARGRALEGVGKDLSTMGASDSVQNSDLEQYAKGSSNQGKMNMAKTLGAGLVNITNKDLEDLQYGSKAGIDSEIGKAKGVRKNYDQYGEDAYKTTSEYGERSNMSKTMAKLDAQGGMEGAISIDTKDSSFKASQQKGSVEGTEETANRIKQAGESIGDALSRISKELTSGKLASDNRMINEFNDNYKHGGYVGAQEDSASLKAAQTMGNIKAQRSFGFLDDSGITTKGLKSNEIAPMENAAIADAKYSTFYGDKAQESAESVAKELKDSSLRSTESTARSEAANQKLDKDATEKYVANAIANKSKEVDSKFKELGITNDKDQVQTGDAMVQALAKMGAMNYASSKTLTFDGMDINMGIDSSTGQAKIHKANASRNVNTGDSTSHDSTTSQKTGNSKVFDNDTTTLNNTNPLTTLAMARFNGDLQKAADWARSAEGAKWAMSAENNASLVAAELAHQITPEDKQGDHGEMAAMVAGAGMAGAVGLYGINKFTKKPVKMDTTGYNQITDKDGNIKGYEDAEGNRVADKNGYRLDDDGKKVKKGVFGRATARAWDKFTSLGAKNENSFDPASVSKEGPSKPVDVTTDGSPDHNNNEPKDSTKDHVDSSNKNNSNYNTNSEGMPQNNAEVGKENLRNQLNDRRKVLDEAFKNGEMKIGEYENYKTKLGNIEDRLNDGRLVHMNKLEQVGINPSGMPNNKGAIDFNAFGEKINSGIPFEHPKINGFATHAEAKASGMLDFMKKVPLIGKFAAVGLAGATLAEANEHYDKGEYGKAFFTATSIADVTGASDLALASIESREIQDKILNGRKIESIGDWKNDLKNSSIGKQVSSLFGSDNGSESTPSNFANILRDGQVRAEFGAMNQEQNQQASFFDNAKDQRMELNMMEMRSSINELQEGKQFSDIQITREEFESMQKDLKRIRKK